MGNMNRAFQKDGRIFSRKRKEYLRNRPYFNGAAPLEHRCQAKFKKDPNKKCNQWRMRGSLFCFRHGGRRIQKKGLRRVYGARLLVSKWYDSCLGPTLTAFMSKAASIDKKELFDVTEELKVARLSATTCLIEYSNIVEAVKTGKGRDGTVLTEDMKKGIATLSIIVGEKLIGFMTQVSNIAEKAMKIHKEVNATIDVSQIEELVNQIIFIISEECDACGNMEVAKRINDRLRNTIRLPGTEGSAPGTLVDVQTTLESLARTMIVQQPLNIEGAAIPKGALVQVQDDE